MIGMVSKMEINVRYELSRSIFSTRKRAINNHCEGECDEHEGAVKVFRVYDTKDGFDWGWFSYCENAVAEDKYRGLGLIDDWYEENEND